MHYDGSFEVPGKKEAVFEFITNPRKVTTIFPDASDLKVIDENNFSSKVKVGMSFIRGTLDVKLNFVEKTPPTYAKLKAKGVGISSSVDLTTTFNLDDTPNGGTKVTWVADATISGLMASVGSRLMDSAADKYVKEIIGGLQKALN